MEVNCLVSNSLPTAVKGLSPVLADDYCSCWVLRQNLFLIILIFIIDLKKRKKPKTNYNKIYYMEVNCLVSNSLCTAVKGLSQVLADDYCSCWVLDNFVFNNINFYINL